MMQSSQNEQLTKLASGISRKLDFYELILVLVFILSMILKIVSKGQLNILFILSLSTLSVLYFFNAFAIQAYEKQSSLDIFSFKITSWSCSISVMGILFRIMSWPNSSFMLTIGTVALLISLVLIFFLKKRKSEAKHVSVRWICRIILILSFELLFRFS